MLAQENGTPNAIKMEFAMGKGVLTRSAEKVPENLYSYKPTDDVRSFATGGPSSCEYTA